MTAEKDRMVRALLDASKPDESALPDLVSVDSDLGRKPSLVSLDTLEESPGDAHHEPYMAVPATGTAAVPTGYVADEGCTPELTRFTHALVETLGSMTTAEGKRLLKRLRRLLKDVA